MMTINLENANCGFCGSELSQILYSAPKGSLYSECNIVKCSNCGLVRTNPRPTQTTLTESYTNEYYSRNIPNLQGWSNKWKTLALKHSLSSIYPYVIPYKIPENAVICDVGCGAGEWLARMRCAHPDAVLYGFEIDRETASIAANFCGGIIHWGDFLNNGWSANSFDFITFWDVLEHVPNPKQVMNEVARLLKPNGKVIVVSPNIECIYSRVFKQFWWALLFDQHLYHFSQQTLTQLFQTCQLEPVYFAIPPTCPNASWNIFKILDDMKFKGLADTKSYALLKMLAKVISSLDKVQLSRLLPQHLMMCAQKPMTMLGK